MAGLSLGRRNFRWPIAPWLLLAGSGHLDSRVKRQAEFDAQPCCECANIVERVVEVEAVQTGADSDGCIFGIVVDEHAFAAAHAGAFECKVEDRLRVLRTADVR